MTTMFTSVIFVFIAKILILYIHVCGSCGVFSDMFKFIKKRDSFQMIQLEILLPVSDFFINMSHIFPEKPLQVDFGIFFF